MAENTIKIRMLDLVEDSYPVIVFDEAGNPEVQSDIKKFQNGEIYIVEENRGRRMISHGHAEEVTE